jgi:glycosyltransferase involved in cell wall biosynthesis
MIKKTSKISVIIPTYNRAHLIERSIISVLNQTYQNFEIIVVDDGSIDNTEEIIKKLQRTDNRIRYIKLEKNIGAAAARNIGIKAAKEEYVAFQDSDDEWLPEKIEKQIRVLENAPPNTGIIYSDMLRINENNETEYWHSPKITSGNLINEKKLEYQVSGLGIQTSIIKKECFEKVGLFDEKFPRLIDLEFFIRLSKKYRFEHITEPLVKYYSTVGISTNVNSLITAQNLLIKKYNKEIIKNKKFLSKQYYNMGIALCTNEQFKRGKKYLIKAFRTTPLNTKYTTTVLISLLGGKTFNHLLLGYRNLCNQVRKNTISFKLRIIVMLLI